MHYFLILCLFAPVLSSPVALQPEVEAEPESPAAQFLGLSAGATRVVPNIKPTFSCVGRGYGYYADVDNNCQLFHICHPSKAADGSAVIYHFSKFCPQETRFDQLHTTCLSVNDPKLTTCAQSTQYFAATESRFADIPVVSQQMPETQQRLEQVLSEEQRNEFPVKGTQTVVRSEPFTQQRVETMVSQPQPQPQPIVVRNEEPLQQQTLSAEPVEPLVQRREAAKHPVTEMRNTIPAPLKSTTTWRAPAAALRNTQTIPAQSVVQQVVNTPVHYSQSLPQTQQLYVQPIQYNQPLVQTYIPFTPVIRPAQYSAPVATVSRNAIQTSEQYIPTFNTYQPIYRTVPQYLRTIPAVIRPSQTTFPQI